MSEQLELTEQTEATTTEKKVSPFDLHLEWLRDFKASPVEEFRIQKSEFRRLTVVSPKAFVVSSNINAVQEVKFVPPTVTDAAFEQMQTMFTTYERDTLVTFNNEAQYLYKFVPKGVHDALIRADSVGKYFAANIKGQYVTYKVETVVEASGTGEEIEYIVFTLAK